MESKAAVDPQDFIFHFVLKHPVFSEMDHAIRYYFDDGRRSAELLKSILENDLSVNLTESKEMLEFASGHGAVTRHLPAVFPAFDITSSDIHPDVASKIANATSTPAPDSSVYQSDSKVEGNVESISVDEERGVGQRRRIMRIMGWVAPDVKGGKSADSIILLFRSDDGLQSSCEAIRLDRNDVATAFKNPALVRTGFRATVNISGLKGNLTFLLAIRCDTERKLCHNVSIPLNSCSLD